MIHRSTGHPTCGCKVLAEHPKAKHWAGSLPSLQPLRVICFPSPFHPVTPLPWNSRPQRIDGCRHSSIIHRLPSSTNSAFQRCSPRRRIHEDYGHKVFLRKAVCKSQVKYSQKQKVLSRSAFSSSMAWILHGLTLTGCSWQKDVPADVSEPWLPCFGRWVRHKSLPRMCKGGSFGLPLSSCLCIHNSPTTWPAKGCPEESLEASWAWALWVTSASGIHTPSIQMKWTCHIFPKPPALLALVW